ncbi:hypothetical protein F4859DRAFT_374889 [Xylaria cf. heliscus]|nr:hypothetical protein F4859DRAFT_374889 [Xylaria cf. heliscus]
MDVAIERPDGHGPLEVVAYAIIEEAMERLNGVMDNYLSGTHGLVANDVLNKAIKELDIVKRLLDTLQNLRREPTEEDELQWEHIEAVAEEENGDKKEERPGLVKGAMGKDDSGEGTDGKDSEYGEYGEYDEDGEDGEDRAEATAESEEEENNDPPGFFGPKNAITDFIGVCHKAIEENWDPYSWQRSIRGSGPLDTNYEEARDATEKLLQVITATGLD